MASTPIIRTYIIRARPGGREPVGYIFQWAWGIPDDKYLLCDGKQYMNVCYPELAMVLAGKYGGTKPPSRRWRWLGLYGYFRRRWLRNGVFNAPDLRSRVMVGVDFGSSAPS